MMDLKREEYAFPGQGKLHQNFEGSYQWCFLPPTQGIVFLMMVIVYCRFILSEFELCKFPLNGPPTPPQKKKNPRKEISCIVYAFVNYCCCMIMR
jgi:hypothetical protein